LKIKCVIIARNDSSRVIKKSTKIFYENESLLSHKIKQLKRYSVLSKFDTEIIVSTSKRDIDKEIVDISKNLGVKINYRDDYFCEKHNASMSEIVEAVVKDIDDDDFIFWTPIVTPLMNEFHYKLAENEIISSTFNKESDSLLGVIELKEYFWYDNKPLNYYADMNHVFSQNLKPVYKVTNSIYASTAKNMKNYKYFLTPNVKYLILPKYIDVDIDYDIDFEHAKILIEKARF
jgi:CMP-N-acetylneuraminic acid synthetase